MLKDICSWIRHNAVLLLCASLIAGAEKTVSSAQPLRQAQDRPNILVIMADDLGWMDLHVQGNPHLTTPHLDRLASQGMRFTDAYAAAPVCTPTRAAMMTGQAPARLGITNHAPGHKPGHVPKGRDQAGAVKSNHLPLKQVTIAERLKAAGYATGFIGKWHLSHPGVGNEKTTLSEPALRPEHQGFDLNIGGNQRGGPELFRAVQDLQHHAAQGRRLSSGTTDRRIDRLHREEPRPPFLPVIVELLRPLPNSGTAGLDR